jgi:hypothetical protein
MGHKNGHWIQASRRKDRSHKKEIGDQDWAPREELQQGSEVSTAKIQAGNRVRCTDLAAQSKSGLRKWRTYLPEEKNKTIKQEPKEKHPDLAQPQREGEQHRNNAKNWFFHSN